MGWEPPQLSSQMALPPLTTSTLVKQATIMCFSLRSRIPSPLSHQQQAFHSTLLASVLAAHSWDCAIALVNGTLNGTTEIVVGSGDNMVTFDDLMVEEAGLSYDLEVTCTSSDGNIYLTAMSKPFHVHDYPEVGMLRETDVRFA